MKFNKFLRQRVRPARKFRRKQESEPGESPRGAEFKSDFLMHTVGWNFAAARPARRRLCKKNGEKRG